MATIRVSNQSQLTNALRNVDDGDTILLASGTYSGISMSGSRRNDFDFSSKVTIKSADANRPAVINQALLQNVHNLEISNVVLDYTGSQPGAPGWTRGSPFTFKGTSDITLSGVEIRGHLQNGWGAGTGLYVNNSDGFTMRNSRMSDFKVAVNIWGSEDVVLENNSIRRMNHDGLFLGDIDRIRIEDNFIGDYRPQYPSALHKDSIQFYTGKGFAPSTDVVIRGNTIESPDHRHGIFIFNELYRDGNSSAMHRNILIEDNYIHSTNTHGITVTHANGVTIRDNTVVLNDDAGRKQIPLINVSLLSRDVDIIGNTVYSVQRPGNGSWEVRGNTVQAQSRGHWDGVFKNGALQKSAASALASTEATARLSMAELDDSEIFALDSLDFGPKPLQVIEGLDFGDGDQIVLTGFETGTFAAREGFAGVNVWDDGGSVSIASAEALREVVLRAEAVTAQASADGDDLLVQIFDGDATPAMLALADYLV